MVNNKFDTRRNDRNTPEPKADVRSSPMMEQPIVRGNRPANENDRATAAMMAKLKRQPALDPIIAAFALAAIWVLGCFMVFSQPLLGPNGLLQGQLRPETMFALATLLLPIFVIFTMAYIFWRAQQLRQVSEVLMQSALRLMRPQDIATDGLLSIAQTVRAEIDLLVGGVEHAVQRATVLEEIVHKEIAAIERAFGGNEDRIRSLVNGLESQRAALHQTSLVVGNEVTPLFSRLEANTLNLDQIVNTAQNTLAKLEAGLKTSSNELTRTIDDVSHRASLAGAEIQGQTERMSGMMVGELQTFSANLQDQIHMLDHAAIQLSSGSSNFGKTIEIMESNVSQLMRQGVEQITGANAELTRAIEFASTNSAVQMRDAAAEVSKLVGETGDNITYHLKNTAMDVANLIERNGIDAAEMLALNQNALGENIQTLSNDFIAKASLSRQELENYINQANGEFARTGQETAQILEQNRSAIHVSMENMTSDFIGKVAMSRQELENYLNQASNEFARSGQETAQILEQNRSVIHRSMENMTGEFIGKVAVSRQELETYLTQASNEFARTGQETAQFIEQNRSTLHQSMQNMAGDFIGKISVSRQELESYLTLASTEISGNISNVTGEFNERLSTTSTQFLAGLDQTSNYLLSQLSASGAGLAGRVEETTNRVFAEIGSTSDQLSAKMDQTATALLSRMDSHSSGMVERVENTAERIYNAFAVKAEGLGDTMENTSSRVYSTIEKQTTHLTDKLDETAGRFQHAFQQSSGQILTSMQESAQSLSTLIDSTYSVSSAKLEESANQATIGLQRSTNNFVTAVETSYGASTAKLDETTDRFHNILGDTTNQLANRIDTSSEQLYTHLNASVASANSTLTETAFGISSRLDDSSATIIGQLQSIGSNVNDLLVTTSGTIAVHLKETSDIVSRQMQDSGLALAQNIEGTGGLITDRLIGLSDEFVQKVGNAQQGLYSVLDGSSRGLTDKLEATTSQLYAHLEQSTTTISTDIDRASKRIFSRLNEASDNLSGQLEDSANRVYDHINLTAGDVTERVATVTEQLTKQLDASSAQLDTLLNTTGNRMGTQLEQATTELSALFNANTKMMTQQLDQTSSSVTNTFAETAVRVTNQVNAVNVMMAERLEATSAEVANQLDAAGDTMFSRIDNTARELGHRFDTATGVLEKVTGDISGRLAGTGAKFAEMLSGASTQMLNDLGKASEAFSEGLGHTTMEISGRFEQETGLLVGRIDRAVQEFDSAATGTGTKLDESHRKFSKHVETANTYLSDQLSTAATELDERLETISMQLTGKLEMTGSRISDRLDDVSGLVEKSIDKFNDEMEGVLTSRRDALDKLVADASSRSSEIDAVMTSYMNLIEESLASAESRSRDISRVISEQTAMAMTNLDQEIRKLEATSGGQIGQASRVLREQHERAMASMNEMLSSTASDFQQTAQDMRITAQHVVKDIDATRTELKRAILELPEETRTNADAMRRVVADQIAALNALADVVKRQTGTMDFSGPGFVNRGPPGKSEGTSFAAPVYGTMSAQTNDQERNEAAPASTRNRSIAEMTRGLQSRLSTEATAPKKVAPAPRVDTAAREMDTMTQKLNAAARDLVEAIDGTLPRDLEKSYSGSEKHVYTHRLFEGRGKKLQKIITARYDSERLVRTRVDAFIRLFERLMDMLSNQPQGTALAEAALASETGKIYLMLAHATGAIEN